MRDFFLSLHKRWHFLLIASVVGYIGAALGTIKDRDSIYQYQPFTLLTLFSVISIGNGLYNEYLHRTGKISFFNLLVSGFSWVAVSIFVVIGGVLAAQYLKRKYHIDLSPLLGFPL